MRHGYTVGLAKRLERQNPTAHLICEAVVTVAEDIKDQQDDWDAADSLSGMTTLENGGLKISGSLTTLAENTTSTTTHNDLDRASPLNVAVVKWTYAVDIESREITSVTARLINRREGGNPGEVTFWRARLFRIATIRPGNIWELAQIGSHVDVVADSSYSTSSQTFTFDFAFASGAGPRIGPPALLALEDGISFQPTQPYTVLTITALKGEGVAAGNVAWSADGGNQSITDNGHTVTYEILTAINDQQSQEFGTTYAVNSSPGNGVPRFAIKGGTFAAKTVAFTAGGNDIDLGVAPGGSTKIRVTAQGQTFGTSTLKYELDDSGGMTEVVDGDIIGEDNTGQGGKDLSGMARQQAYDGQVTLTPPAGSDISPIVRRFGISEITFQDLDGLVKFGEMSHELDPVTLVGNLPEIELTLLRDGLRDYRDTATDLLSDNYVNALEFRIWVGHADLDRKDWLHLDTFVIDKQDSAGPAIKLSCVSPLAASLTDIPPKSGSTRAPIVYSGKSLKFVYDDILTAQVISFPGRRIGAVVEDTTTVTKTITGPVKGKTELDRVAYLAGGGAISSQGRIKFVDMFKDAAPLVFFPADTIRIIRVDQGYEERVPDIAVGYGYNTTIENDFLNESYSSVADAITNYGRALIDRTENLDEEIAKWIINNTLGKVIADRITQNFATGVPLIAFESIYPMPWLEPGDAVAVQTDRIVFRDPHTGDAVRGNLWVLGRIAACHTTFGTKFTVWGQDYLDVLPTNATISRTDFAATSQITGIEITFNEEAKVIVSASGDLATDNMYVTVGNGSAPSDPTVSTNDGSISGRTGSVATAIKVTTGNDAFVKVIGANANADVGPVHSVKLRRDLGPFHKDATTRSHTGNTNETVLETISLPANALGTEGSFRMTLFWAATGTAGTKQMVVDFGSTEVLGVFADATTGLVQLDFLMVNDGATNVQQWLVTIIESSGSADSVLLSNPTSAEDTTTATDIIISTKLTNGADTMALEFSLVEYIGRN